jgi:hypothetical protein
MRIPQVTDRISTDRIKEAPAQALRAVFAGIGQLLVVADRIRKQGNDPAQAGRPAGGPDRGTVGEGASAQESPAQATPAQETPAQASPVKARRSLDQTGNVRLLSADDLVDDLPVPPPVPPPAEPATETAPADVVAADVPSADASPADVTPADVVAADVPSADASPADVTPAGVSPAGADGAADAVGETALPVPNYDSLTLPSLRARLRMLDAHQLRVLIAYERTHAGRADVVAMFERRIAKLAAEG